MLCGRNIVGGLACLSASFAIAPQLAFADMQTALDLCLNSDLTLDARAEAFADKGWVPYGDTKAIDAALAHAILISGLAPNDPESWSESQSRSTTIATRMRGNRGYDNVRFLANDRLGETITIEPNGSGLATCLYVGQEHTLTALNTFLPENTIRQTGPQLSIRGETGNGVVIAYAMTEAAVDKFVAPLVYSATFTVVLDRTEGS